MKTFHDKVLGSLSNLQAAFSFPALLMLTDINIGEEDYTHQAFQPY